MFTPRVGESSSQGAPVHCGERFALRCNRQFPAVLPPPPFSESFMAEEDKEKPQEGSMG